MANTVYTVEEVELQDGSLVTLRPASIKVMRKGTEMLSKLGDVEDNDEGIRALIDIVVLCLKRERPDFEHEVTRGKTKKVEPNYDLLEDLFDMDTIFRTIEVYLGVKLNDPKLMEAAMAMAMETQKEESSSTS